MTDIIVAFPKEETAKNIKNILVRSGYTVRAACTTGAQVLSHAGEMNDGIVVCTPKLVDMLYKELCDYLPQDFQMLLIANQPATTERSGHQIICLGAPLKVHELLSTVEMMENTATRLRKKRRQRPRQKSAAEIEIINQAKNLLMERNHMTEDEAHRYIQKLSMDGGHSFHETAQMILAMQ